MDLQQVISGRINPQPTSQNLISQSSLSTGGSEPGFYKSIIIDVVALISAGLFGYSYYRYLTAGLSVWLLLAAVTFFAVLSVLQVFLSKKSARTFLVIFVETILVAIFFRQDDYRVLLITSLIVLALLTWGYFSARSRLNNSIELRFFGISGTTLSKFTTAILLFMILIYVPQLNNNPIIVSQQNFSTFFDWASGLINSFYPNVSLNGSFGDFAQSLSKSELQGNPNFQNLSAAQQDVAVQQQSDAFSKSFLQNSTAPIASSSPTSDAFYGVLTGILNAWQSQSGSAFDIGWVAVLFIALRSVAILFIWFAEFVSLLFYEAMLALGFMKVAEEERAREIITY